MNYEQLEVLILQRQNKTQEEKKNFESKYEESEPDENWAQDEKGCEEFITQWDDISG